MLRINLLPPYIYEGSRRKLAMVVWAAAVLIVAVVAVLAKVKLENDAKAWKDKTEATRPTADEATRTAALAKDIEAKSADTVAKADFVYNANKYVADTYPQLFGNINLYTLRNVMYDSVDPQGNTVTMSAYARDLATVAHYMMAMERNKKINNVSIAIGSIPAFPVTPGFNIAAGGAGVRPPDGTGHNFTVTLTLVDPVPGGPTYPGGWSGGGSVGAPGSPMGGMGSFGSGMSGGFRSSGPPMMGSGGYRGGGPPPGYGGPPPGYGGPPRGAMGSGGGYSGGTPGRPTSGYGPPPGMGGPPPGYGGPPPGTSARRGGY